jgi:predicted ATPase/DNA-binding SARP family transcriptional activator
MITNGDVLANHTLLFAKRAGRSLHNRAKSCIIPAPQEKEYVAGLTVRLLGAPQIERAGTPIDVDTRKAIALLAYLAVTGQRHGRDALAALLWPENDQANARGALRRTLSALNKAFGGTGLEVERESVGLDERAGLWIDVAEFRRLLDSAPRRGRPTAETCARLIPPLVEAAALYRGDFMDGFSLRDSASFDDWQFFQAENLRRDLSGALERLVECHIVLGAFEPAIGYARRHLALDPLHEPAHRQLMRLYAWAGQRAAALHQYRECARILDQELGVAPLEETAQLAQAIKENRLASPDAYDAETSAAPAATTYTQQPSIAVPQSPLVGRAREWSALLSAYAAAGPDGRLIVLEGEAGIGKTRLAEDLLAYSRAAGGLALAAHCYEGAANLAYGPFVEALRAALAQPGADDRLRPLPPHWLAEAARLLPELATLRPELPPAPPLDSPGAQGRFFEGVVQALVAATAGQAPGVVLLDDLHWADPASLDLLAYFTRRLRGQPLCLLITWRGEHLPAEHRGRAMLAEAQRAGLAALVQLVRLSRADVVALVRSSGVAAAQARTEELGARLYDETEGLPLFLVEYLAALAREDAPDTGADWPLPAGARDLLRSRLAPAGETARQLLTAAATIGRSFDDALVRATSGRGEDETVDALEELLRLGLVIESVGSGVRGLGPDYGRAPLIPDPRALTPVYDFSHEKLRALVYAETSLARRRLLHRRVAEALVGRSHGGREAGALAGQIAHHYQMAGDEPAAAEYYRLAGTHARGLYANAEALAHFRAALALGHSDATLHEATADLHTLLGEYSAALAGYATAIARDPAALARLERKRADIHRRRGEWDRAEHHLQAAQEALGHDAPDAERARLYADRSLTAHRREQPERALELAQQGLALAEAAGDARALVEAHNILGILASHRGNLDAARAHLERSLALAETLGEPGARAAALNNLALACGAAGDTARALALAETAVALCAAQGDRHREAALHNNLADLLYAAGRGEDAMAHLKRAVAIFAEIGADTGEMQPEIWKLVEW